MNNILVTVSGGKTSAFMAVYMKERYPNLNLLFCFANTGREKEETLRFLKQLDNNFSLNIVWLEPLVNPKKGVGTTYKIVDFKSACRDGKIFEDVIKKYGLPSKMYRHCTRELKERPIHAYAKEIFPNGYLTAMGIRSDEKHRLSPKKNYIYPLAEINVTQSIINDWWDRQTFNLDLKPHEGNCDFCFLKSHKKRVRLIKEGLDVSWWLAVEEKYKTEIQPMFDVRNQLKIQDLIKQAELEMTQISMFDNLEFDCFCGN